VKSGVTNYWKNTAPEYILKRWPVRFFQMKFPLIGACWLYGVNVLGISFTIYSSHKGEYGSKQTG
jgi:hypothetical protein